MGFNHNYAASCGMNNCAPQNDCGSGGFGCIINLIIILIVLQFLTQIICGMQCDEY